MGRTGVFRPRERIELLDGEIITMAAIGDDHLLAVNDLNMWFAPRLAGRAIVSVQNSIRLDNRSEPQPDLAILRLESALVRRHPRPEDVLLLIEVSDKTLRVDLERKTPRFAAAGIPEAWVFNLRHKQVHVFRAPREGVYTETEIVRSGTITPQAFPDLARPFAAIFR